MDSEGISNTHLPRHGWKSFSDVFLGITPGAEAIWNECPGGIAAAWQINHQGIT